ncbi:MAG TPA: hypothetical protein VH593_20885 [Ktedonobacteraceae bacterium]
MEGNSQQQRQGQDVFEQLDFSGKALLDEDAPTQLDFSGKALSDEDNLESPISADQQSQDQAASPSLASPDQRKFPKPISSGNTAALNTLLSVLAQPPIPKLPQHQSRSSHTSNRRRLPIGLIGLAAALAAVILFVPIVFPGSNAPQHSGKAANAPATASTGSSSSSTQTTPHPPTRGTQSPTNNPTQPPANNGNLPGAPPVPPKATNPAPPPITPIPVANSGVLMVSPGVVQVNNMCQSNDAGFRCVLTLSPAAGHNLVLWIAHPEGLGAVVILPLTDTLLLGQHQQVTVLLPTCVNGGDIRFTANDTTAVVPFQC